MIESVEWKMNVVEINVVVVATVVEITNALFEQLSFHSNQEKKNVEFYNYLKICIYVF